MYIIFLCFLTILVFGTLFKSFGFTMNQEKEQSVKDFVNKISNDNNTVNGQVVKKDVFGETIKNAVTNVKHSITKEDKKEYTQIYNNFVNKKENGFDKELFLKSSDRAVTNILDYFSNENLEFLQKLLTPEMYQTFEKQINVNKENKVRYKTVVLSIDNKELLELTEYDTKAKVKLSMQQFNFVEDDEGNLIRGSKDKVQHVDEVWTFTKKDDSWLLSSID